MNGPPVLTILNNRQQFGKGAMPLKDSMSSNDADFRMARLAYTKMTFPVFDKNRFGNTNRSASSVTESKKIQSTGQLNAVGSPLAYTAPNRQDVTQALKRVRSSGYIVPPKVSKVL